MTLETVVRETPALSATCRIVALIFALDSQIDCQIDYAQILRALNLGLSNFFSSRQSSVVQWAIRQTASEEDRRLIFSARRELRSINHEEIEETIAALCGCAAIRSDRDIHGEAAGQMEVYVLEKNLEWGAGPNGNPVVNLGSRHSQTPSNLSGNASLPHT
jgi:hypothetical protein